MMRHTGSSRRGEAAGGPEEGTEMAYGNGEPRWARGTVVMLTTCALLSFGAKAADAARTHAAHARGYLSICEQESGTGLEGMVFNFNVAGRIYSAPVGA